MISFYVRPAFSTHRLIVRLNWFAKNHETESEVTHTRFFINFFHIHNVYSTLSSVPPYCGSDLIHPKFALFENCAERSEDFLTEKCRHFTFMQGCVIVAMAILHLQQPTQGLSTTAVDKFYALSARHLALLWTSSLFIVKPNPGSNCALYCLNSKCLFLRYE